MTEERGQGGEPHHENDEGGGDERRFTTTLGSSDTFQLGAVDVVPAGYVDELDLDNDGAARPSLILVTTAVDGGGGAAG